MNEKKTREPFILMAKRAEALPAWKQWGIRFLGFLISLVIAGIVIMAVSGLNPVAVFVEMGKGALGSTKRFWVTTRDAMTMLCIAVGLAPAFKMRFWNIGAEGQILVGGIASAAVMIYLGNKLSALPCILLMIVCAAVAGGIWGFFPGFFKAKWNANETLFTLMMNYIGIQLTKFFVAKWENPFGSNSVGIINSSTKGGWLPNMFSKGYNGDFGWNVLIVLIITLFMYLYMNKSKHGYEIAVIGDSVNTARYAGIRVNKAYVRTIILSGAICGIAGMIAVSGASHSISASTAGGRGFTAIIVAWLAQFNSVVMIIFSYLIVVLQKGAQAIASAYNISEEVSDIVTGIILFCVLGSEFFVNYVIRFSKRKKEGK